MAMQSEGVKQAGVMTAGNLFATAVAAVAMIIISRGLGPEQFGVFSALFSLILILSKFGDLGISIAVQRYVANLGDSGQAVKIVQTSLYSKLILSFILLVFGLIFGEYLAVYLLKLPDYASLVKLAFVLVFGVIIYEQATTLLTGLQKFNQAVIANLLQSTGKLLLVAGLIYRGLLTVGTGFVLYGLVPLVSALFSSRWLPRTFLLPRFDAQAFRQLIAIAKWTSLSIIAASLAENIDIVIVQSLMNPYDTGLWASAVRIATLASLIGWSLGSVLNIRVAKYSDKKNLDVYLRKASLLALSAAVLTLLLVPFSSFLITLTVGPEYTPASASLNLLLISTAFLTATSPFAALFYLFDRPEYFAYSGILSAVSLIAGDLLLIPILGTTGAGYARIIMRLLVLGFTLVYARRAYRDKYGR